MVTYEVQFERTLNKKTSLEGSVPLTAVIREVGEKKLIEKIESELDDESLQVQLIEKEGEDEMSIEVIPNEEEKENEDVEEVDSDEKRDEKSVEVVLDEKEDEVSIPGVEYEKIVYQEVVVEGKAPVEVESGGEAEKKFLSQVRNRGVRGGKYSGELDPEFEIVGVEKWR